MQERADRRSLGSWVVPAASAALLICGCAVDSTRPCNPTPAVGELGTICGFRNPEDVEVVPSMQALIVSEMSDERPGSLAVVDLRVDSPAPVRLWPVDGTTGETRSQPTAPPGWLDADCSTPPIAGRFSPHGITAVDAGNGSAIVAVVSHGDREAIEAFGLERSEAGSIRARWLGCSRLPPRTYANDVVVSEHGAVLATRYRTAPSGIAAAFSSVVAGLGGTTGEVLRKLPGGDWEPVTDTRAAGANGLLESAGTVYFAQTGSGTLSAVQPDGGRRDVPIEGHPDNLSWGPDGTIYLLSHRDGLGFLACAAGWRPCRTSWSLFEIDPDSMRVRERLRHDGRVLGAVASVASFDGRWFFGAVFGDRIGVMRSGDREAGVLQNPEFEREQ